MVLIAVLIGPIIIWYTAGVVIVAIFVLERWAAKHERDREVSLSLSSSQKESSTLPIYVAALVGAAIIFLIWPWVALSLARHATL